MAFLPLEQQDAILREDTEGSADSMYTAGVAWAALGVGRFKWLGLP